MKSYRYGVSRAALAAALMSAAFSSHALAQDAQVQPGGPIVTQDTQGADIATEVEAIVSTGTLIRGAREDGVVAVDVYTAENLIAVGAPNPVEFTRMMPQTSQAFGEADIDLGGTASGAVTVNLRGLGAQRTLVLLNGHRTSGDLSFLPMNAIGRVEVLKDGAGVTYGAGAVAGVINYVTRDKFDGLEVSLSHKFVSGSDGEPDASILYGKTGDRGDFLLSAMIAHQAPLNFTDRDYGFLPFEVNPTQYIAFSVQPGYYVAPNVGGGYAATNDFTPASCTAMGGVQPNATTSCYYTYTPFFNFVDKQTNYRLFGSANFDVTDDMRVHFEAGYSKTDVPKIWAASTLPPIASHRAVVGADSPSLCFNGTTTACQFEIPISNQGVTNPFIAEFYTRNRPGQPIPTTGKMYTGFFWEPWAMNGNPLYPGGARYESRTSERWGSNFRVSGEFTEGSAFGFLDGVTYDYAVTGGITRTVVNRRDVVVSRMQNALRGYGGPNCKAIDRSPTNYAGTRLDFENTVGIQDSATAPGSNGCLWYNPFASAYATSGVNGNANPSYAGAAYENSLELVDWLIADKPVETRDSDINLDAVYTGDIGRLELPGGAISWALGAQHRATSNRTASLAPDEFRSTVTQLCPWPAPGVGTAYPGGVPDGQAPGQTGCTDNPGAFWGTGSFTPAQSKQKITSLFGELRLPILDTLEAQLAVRHEDYDRIGATVYKVAAKWDVTDWFSLRGSYSTNYAPPPSEIGNSDPVVGAAYVTRFTTFIPTLTDNIPGIKPEEAKVMNLGALFRTERFGSDSFFTASLDYFDFEISGQIVTTSTTVVLNNVAPPGTQSGLNTLLNCSSPHMAFVNLGSAACVQGTTTVANINQVLAYQTNGPGQSTAGFDIGVDYMRPWGAGDFSIGLSGTLVTKYEVEGYSVNGVLFETGGDRLGFSNVSRSADFSSKLRGNMYASYRLGAHTFRGQVNYTKGVYDELGLPTGYPQSPFGIFPTDYMDLDLHYRLAVPWVEDTDFRLSILNVTDEDPMPAQVRNSYYSGVGNARGRQIELGVTKTF